MNNAKDGEQKDGEQKDGEKQQLDLVFTMDCTGSMGSYIAAAKQNIRTIVDRLTQSEGYDLRFALIAYRDHPPQDMTYVTKTFAFTADVSQMKRDLDTLSAQGGGDGPEAVAAGLKATLDSAWRPNATKVCVLIADAPPHGLGESGDGFPNGAPDGIDPFETLTQMSMRGICIYSVGCEPALSGYRYAKDFFVAAAQKTNGQAVSLRSAAALADVIMGGAIEEMDLQQLADEVVAEVRSMRAAKAPATGELLGGLVDGYDSEEERAVAWEAIQSRGHNTRHMKTKKLKSKNADAISKLASLEEARIALGARASSPPQGGGGGGGGGARHRCRGGRGRAVALSAAMAPGAPPRARWMARAASPEASFRSIEAETCEVASLDGDEGPARRSRSPRSMREWASDSDSADECAGSSDDEDGAPASAGGVRLETRALSFSQMSRIYGKQKKMGFL